MESWPFFLYLVPMWVDGSSVRVWQGMDPDSGSVGITGNEGIVLMDGVFGKFRVWRIGKMNERSRVEEWSLGI